MSRSSGDAVTELLSSSIGRVSCLSVHCDRRPTKPRPEQEQGGGFRHRLQGDLLDRKEPIVPGADGSDKGRRVDEADEGLIFLRKRGLDSCFLVEINGLAAALKALW